ncbi:hypothetical protein ACFV1B_08140 [Streptomyces sp. NPDC059637]|uniref:hypothetical protein n=1 Tax=Streptomyces sp. NPDC059637 TaxID=3347752 RepID=UPI0036A454F7
MRAVRTLRTLLVAALLVPAAVQAAAHATPSSGTDTRPAVRRSADSGPAVRHDTSPPLRSMHSARPGAPVRPDRPRRLLPHRPSAPSHDPVVQRTGGRLPRIPVTTEFEGIRSERWLPPDPNAAVGTTQIVQTVNTRLAVYTKTGDTVVPPVSTGVLWSGFGDICEGQDQSDAVVRWDGMARRWIITQLDSDEGAGRFYECMAISTGADASGSWHRYAYRYSRFNDYPKLSVWPDAYYITYNTEPLKTVCALDRARMLVGDRARQQCFETDTFDQADASSILLGSDMDGSTPPPRGAPNLLVGLGPDDSLSFWKFHVDWARPERSALTGPSVLRVAPYTPACEGDDPERCIPQKGTRQKLDSISYWPMYRFAYRNFGSHQSLVLSHAVDARGGVGERWYELRLANGRPTVHQQSTYAPDRTYRWMGSLAQDRKGNIALGYSQSSPETYPSIRITGRRAGDPRGVMTFRETVVTAGRGSQTGCKDCHRWGDYTSMAVDPVDGCTFWYTNQYQPATGNRNWRTRIAGFALPGCTPSHRDDHGRQWPGRS